MPSPKGNDSGPSGTGLLSRRSAIPKDGLETEIEIGLGLGLLDLQNSSPQSTFHTATNASTQVQVRCKHNHFTSTTNVNLQLPSVLITFSALVLLAGRQEGHLACKNGVMRYWRGYRSAARCKCGPTDATAISSSLAPVQSRMVCLLVLAYPSCPGKKAIKRM